MSCQYGDQAECKTAENNFPKENNNNNAKRLRFQCETSSFYNDNGDCLDRRNGITRNEVCVPQNWYDDE